MQFPPHTSSHISNSICSTNFGYTPKRWRLWGHSNLFLTLPNIIESITVRKLFLLTLLQNLELNQTCLTPPTRIFFWKMEESNHFICIFTGANIYCLDKNYGGVLIIWDRLFGTFSEERPDEEIVYGLVMNQPSFNILHLQVGRFQLLFFVFPTLHTNFFKKYQCSFFYLRCRHSTHFMWPKNSNKWVVGNISLLQYSTDLAGNQENLGWDSTKTK